MDRSFDKIYNSPLNKSRTKATHKFGTSPRFKTNHSISSDFYLTHKDFIQKSFCHNRTIQTEKRFLKDSHLQRQLRFKPSPCEYDVNKSLEKIKNNQINIKIGRASRFKTQKQQVPGPGTYSPQVQLSRSQIIFEKSKKKSNYMIPNPLKLNKQIGPGSYVINPQLQKKIHKFSTSKRFVENNQRKLIPGPGQYNLEAQNTITNSSYSFQKAKRKEFFQISTTPGPGAYSDFSEFSQRTYRLIQKAKKLC